jgi:hypothetical protein
MLIASLDVKNAHAQLKKGKQKREITKGVIGCSQLLLASMEHGFVDDVQVNATSNPHCES